MTCNRCNGRILHEGKGEYTCINCGHRPSSLVPLGLPKGGVK